MTSSTSRLSSCTPPRPSWQAHLWWLLPARHYKPPLRQVLLLLIFQRGFQSFPLAASSRSSNNKYSSCSPNACPSQPSIYLSPRLSLIRPAHALSLRFLPLFLSPPSYFPISILLNIIYPQIRQLRSHFFPSLPRSSSSSFHSAAASLKRTHSLVEKPKKT